MFRAFMMTAIFLTALGGCQRDETPPPAPAKKGELKIDVPGVKIDIERRGEPGRKKVDVDIKVNPK